MQYSTEKPADTLTVTVYGNKEASFTLYEDENENYNYESGKFSKIKLSYTAATKTFTAALREGSFEGMLAHRVFKIVFVDSNASVSGVLDYDGKLVLLQKSKAK
jgi:alpha-D-xyloside xylohydrolase